MNDSESDAMWRLYLKSNEGVAITSTVSSLYSAFEETRLRVGCSKVRYLDYEKDAWYHPVEFPDTSYNTLTPLIHKRKEFVHEREYRLYYHASEARSDDNYWEKQSNHIGLLIPVNVNLLIHRVILPPTAEKDVQTAVMNLMSTYGYSFPITKSALQSSPLYWNCFFSWGKHLFP